MLRTRLWMGTILAAMMAGVLVVDQRFETWCPFLFVLLVTLALIACLELRRLLPKPRRPVGWLAAAGVVGLLAANWIARWKTWDPWLVLTFVFAAVLLAAFVQEMAVFAQPGVAVDRLALTMWLIAYLGLLPCFLVQVRWLTGPVGRAGREHFGAVALALAIFVPKAGDIGAYFAGRFLGKHKMSPILSPKKTWEGAAGGLAASVAATFGIDRLGPIGVFSSWWSEVGFGLVIGVAGMIGDLAESLIKRDCQQKDASHVLPGFGGVLDVVDAILFAAPVVFLWLSAE